MKKIRKLYTSVLLISLLLAITTVKGQEDSLVFVENVIPKSWFELGIGAKKFHSLLGGKLSFRVADRMAISIRGSINSEVRDPFIIPFESFWDITPGVAYAPVVGPIGMISAIAGLGITGGVRRGQFLQREALLIERYKELHFRRLAVAFEFSGAIFLPGTRGLGLVVSIYTNLNSERPFTGYYIGIQLRDTR